MSSLKSSPSKACLSRDGNTFACSTLQHGAMAMAVIKKSRAEMHISFLLTGTVDHSDMSNLTKPHLGGKIDGPLNRR